MWAIRILIILFGITDELYAVRFWVIDNKSKHKIFKVEWIKNGQDHESNDIKSWPAHHSKNSTDHGFSSVDRFGKEKILDHEKGYYLCLFHFVIFSVLDHFRNQKKSTIIQINHDLSDLEIMYRVRLEKNFHESMLESICLLFSLFSF